MINQKSYKINVFSSIKYGVSSMFYKANTELFKDVDKIKAKILCVGHASVGKEWCGKRISPDYSRLYFVLNGSFKITLKDGESQSFTKGKWYLLPSGMDFDFECQDSMEHIYFHIKLCGSDGVDLLSVCKKPLSLSDSKQVDFIKDGIDSSSLTTGIKLKNAALDIVSDMIAYHRIPLLNESHSPCIKKALVYIRENLSARLTLSEISEALFISKSTLTKHFQKELSVSVNEYVTRLIMSEAEALLSTTALSIGAISERLGFSDQLYFSRRFKELHGISPSEYRKKGCYLIG